MRCVTRCGRLVLVSALLLGCGERSRNVDPSYAPTIEPARFVAAVDNPYFPLVPGTTFLYAASNADERVEVTVTTETKEVMGVTCTVVRSREYEGDRLAEETLDWYAQDVDGAVWYFGEDTREYAEDGKVSDEGSWQAGRHGALRGSSCRPRPRSATRTVRSTTRDTRRTGGRFSIWE